MNINNYQFNHQGITAILLNASQWLCFIWME